MTGTLNTPTNLESQLFPEILFSRPVEENSVRLTTYLYLFIYFYVAYRLFSDQMVLRINKIFNKVQ